jgi:hypothetical protein
VGKTSSHDPRLAIERSVQAAARAAGIITESTPLQRLLRDWEAASPDERKQFLALVSAQKGGGL